MLQLRPALSYSFVLQPVLLLICYKQVPEYAALNSFMEVLCKVCIYDPGLVGCITNAHYLVVPKRGL